MKKSKIIKQLQAQLEIERAANKTLNLINIQTEQHLQIAEKALEKYKKLLSISVDDM